MSVRGEDSLLIYKDVWKLVVIMICINISYTVYFYEEYMMVIVFGGIAGALAVNLYEAAKKRGIPNSANNEHSK